MTSEKKKSAAGAGAAGAGAGTLDPYLLEILVCPLTKTPLRYDAEREELISEAAGLAYPVRDGIPIMLEKEARAIAPAKPRPKSL